MASAIMAIDKALESLGHGTTQRRAVKLRQYPLKRQALGPLAQPRYHLRVCHGSTFPDISGTAGTAGRSADTQ